MDVFTHSFCGGGVGWGRARHTTVPVWKLEGDLQGSVLSSQHVDFGDQSQVIGFVDNHVSQLRCFHNPQVVFKMFSVIFLVNS